MTGRQTLAAVTLAAVAITAGYFISKTAIQPWTPSPLAAKTYTFEWNASADVVSGYRLYCGIEPGTYTKRFDAGSNVDATITNLLPGITYYLTVTAVGTNGVESDPAQELEITIPSQGGWGVFKFNFAAGTAHTNDIVEQSSDLVTWTNSPYSVIGETNHDGSAADVLSPIDPTRAAGMLRIRL